MGFVWKVEHKKADGTLLIGYEYTYDLLGRVVQSVERPSGDVTAYTYTPAGRLESEGRTGQVAYSRSYAYNPDGSRAFVMRDDVVNGTHWDFYAYDAVSGRLESVLDVWTGEVNNFVWNPEGTLARWENNQPNSYARVFGYDEEGRLLRIERDYGDGSLQLAYAYGYNSDGVRVWKQDVLSQQEYRYVCRIGCGGIPMRVYIKELSDTRWLSLSSVHAYLSTLIGGNQLRMIIRQVGTATSYMSTDSSQLPALLFRDRFGMPTGNSPEISDPLFILPMKYPRFWLPFFPKLPLPAHPVLPPVKLPLPVGVGVSPVQPSPSHPNPPVIPPAPPTLPNPPRPPGPPPPGSMPPGEPSACETYKANCPNSEGSYDFGECTLNCIMCCGEICGPAAYSACAASCPEEPGDCGVTVVDPPDIPEDVWDWLEKICELLQAWEVIPDDVPCKAIPWIQFL
ncbi:MAG: hypothetical protein KatS3mg017_0025 [Fimbriimonadales bacterium]|nr:MAG: hypothetical protein KatS3mg017_0025 [Fimbriimonadales bacterium]